LDGNPKALPDERIRAKIPEQYGYNGWPWEDSVIPGAQTHNFHFTTEVVYWFEYQASLSPTLDFTGDDDVWVFINGKLVVDLGGAHVPENGSVTLNAATASMLGLANGNVYEIRVFHAERKANGSSFELTLAGFNTARSECTPICGDGIVTLGEECDDGVNDGGYGECEPGCVLGPRCGDGIVQDGEDCDDGNRLDGDACGSACRRLRIR
jgi:fibro-slime domain-containing protein